jgi:hypothetical protein
VAGGVVAAGLVSGHPFGVSAAALLGQSSWRLGMPSPSRSRVLGPVAGGVVAGVLFEHPSGVSAVLCGQPSWRFATPTPS